MIQQKIVKNLGLNHALFLVNSIRTHIDIQNTPVFRIRNIYDSSVYEIFILNNCGDIFPISIILNFKELFSDLNFIKWFWKSVIIILLKGMIYDIILYSFWLLLWYIKPLRNIIYDNKKLFFIYFRYIPFLWNFWAFFWWMFTDKVDIWRDFKLLLYWNLLAIIIYWVIWDAITLMWWEWTLDWYNPSFD